MNNSYCYNFKNKFFKVSGREFVNKYPIIYSFNISLQSKPFK